MHKITQKNQQILFVVVVDFIGKNSENIFMIENINFEFILHISNKKTLKIIIALSHTHTYYSHQLTKALIIILFSYHNVYALYLNKKNYFKCLQISFIKIYRSF